jgi:hypothetical protein
VGHDAFSALHFISSIAYQIAEFSPAFCDVLGQRDGGIHEHADWAGHFEQLLGTPMSRLSPSLTTLWVIVIDALDECGSRAELRQLMTILGKCIALPLAFFVTGRPEPEVKHEMEGTKLLPLVVVEILDAVDPASTESDIREYFTVALENLGNNDGVPTSVQIEQCVMRCGGLFEVMAIQLRWLQENCDSGFLSHGNSSSRARPRVDALF